MSSTMLGSFLPRPQNQVEKYLKEGGKASSPRVSPTSSLPPPYRKRQNWVPRSDADYGDGGAFPEIHIAQYPQGIGRLINNRVVGNTLSLQVDANGNVQYDAIVKHGHSSDRIIKSTLKDLLPLKQQAENKDIYIDRPDKEVVGETAERTRAALEKIVEGKIAAARPKNIAASVQRESTYVRYTPGQQYCSKETGNKQRLIRMVELPVDPLEPSKFRHKKIPRAPPSPPPPVLHSPPRKLTAEEQKAWLIPPCISNWKNAKGYTIPLDKRLAADGRGLQEIQINDNFAKFSEALYAADRHAREEVRERALMQQKLAQKEKEAKEENLRRLAQKAREERAGVVASIRASTKTDSSQTAIDKGDFRDAEGSEKLNEVHERERIRRERQKEREREMRMSRMGAELKAKHASREDRDISEKIALGMAQPTYSKESMFDARLFNQTEGLDTGFKDDEAYTVYDKPLFTGSSAAAIYKPTGAQPSSTLDYNAFGHNNEEEINEMLAEDRFGSTLASVTRGFKGADERTQVRDGPVQFEKVADPFGLDEFLNEAKNAKRPRKDQ